MKWILLLAFLLVSGCVSNSDNLVSDGDLTAYAAAFEQGCKLKSKAESIYICPNSMEKSFNNCTFVNKLVKKDGTAVSSHFLCKIIMPSKYKKLSKSNCYRVNGYYLQSGTYVRGYTVCR